ncbi:MAG: alkaline phosphatase family protein, partial [Bacteroidales bacterium]|nr:alkaline phosphatase family protein [Bacteroidales bacterium]
NHYSMATGLYPDHHGIVANTFIDRKSNRTFKIVDPETRGDHYFYGGEPIWITAEKQGLRTASYFWVGSDVDGLHPTYWKPYENSIPYEQRIDSIIAWLQMPQPQRPHLITWYFPEPDMTGHTYGPDSPQIDSLITALDRYVGIFMDKLEKLPVYPHTNVIITSDHGMASISPEQVIRIHELLPDSLIVAYSGSNPVITIDVVDEYIDLAKSILQEQPHLKVWKSSEVPERLHYGTHERTLDLIVAADNHWSIFYNDAELTSKGTHGFDNDEKDMHAIFYAMGPAFKTNTTVPTFENVSLYTLIATIMNLKPEPTDGSPEHIKPMLK